MSTPQIVPEPTGAVVPEWTLGDRLRKAREFRGWKQADMADYLETSVNTVTGYEKDRVKPKRVVINAWADACGVRRHWLHTGQVSEGNAPVTLGIPKRSLGRGMQPSPARVSWSRRAARLNSARTTRVRRPIQVAC